MREGAVALALLFACGLVYGQTGDHGFLRYDDAIYVFENPNLRDRLDLQAVARAFRAPYEANWIPLTWLSLHLDRTLFGFEPAAFHAMNVLQHALAAILLFFALLRMTGALGASAFVAGVFAVHPLHVESVAWIAERKDTLSGLFFAATLLAHARYVERPGPARYAAVAAALSAGLLAKPMLVTLPAVLLLLDFWPLRRLGTPAELRRALLEKLPLLALCALASVAALYAQQDYGSMEHGDALPTSLRISNALVSLLAYLRDAFWPSGLAVFYPHPLDALSGARAALAGGMLLALTGVALWQQRRRPYLIVGWLWFVGMLVPVLGLVQVGMQARADRYTYLPLIGLSLALAWLANDLARSPRARRGLAVTAGAALLALTAAAHAQVRHWRDTETLFRHAAAVTRNNGVAHQWLGSELLRRGALDEAEQEFRQAARLHPKWATPRRGLADVHAERGEWREAILGYERALRLAPKDARAHMRLARALVAVGESSEALGRARHALKQSDLVRRPEALLVLGLVHGERGELEASLAAYDAALALRPEMAEAHASRGLVLLRLGRRDDASRAFDRALALGDPALAKRVRDTLARHGQR